MGKEWAESLRLVGVAFYIKFICLYNYKVSLNTDLFAWAPRDDSRTLQAITN